MFLDNITQCVQQLLAVGGLDLFLTELRYSCFDHHRLSLINVCVCFDLAVIKMSQLPCTLVTMGNCMIKVQHKGMDYTKTIDSQYQ